MNIKKLTFYVNILFYYNQKKKLFTSENLYNHEWIHLHDRFFFKFVNSLYREKTVYLRLLFCRCLNRNAIHPSGQSYKDIL